MNTFKSKWVEILALVISIITLAFSIYSYVQNISLQREYDILSTYEMPLKYQLKISNIVGEGSFEFDGTEINTGRIEIVPKTGGIEKVYAIHFYEDNVKAVLPVELYADNVLDKRAQDIACSLTDYTIDKVAETIDRSYGTLYLVIKDYQGNCFTNMIVFDVEKGNTSKLETRIYTDIDLLHAFNEKLTVLPQFDADQMQEYLNLKQKLEEII